MTLENCLSRLVLIMSLVIVGPGAFAFDVKVKTTSPVASGTDGTLDSDGRHTITSAGSVVLDGNPAGDIAVTLDHVGIVKTLINGVISVLDDHQNNATLYDTSNAIGLQIGTGTQAIGGDVTLGLLAAIRLLDTRARVDNDKDKTLDGITNDKDTASTSDDVYVAGAYAQDTGRIGVQLGAALTGNLYAQAGSNVLVETNDGYAFFINKDVSGYLHLNGNINLTGNDTTADNTTNLAAVRLTGNVGQFYRQGGAVSVRGENATGISVEGVIGQSLQLEGSVTVAGFQSSRLSNNGLVSSETKLDTKELKLSAAAVKLSGNINEGLLINGPINGAVSKTESDSTSAISKNRTNNQNVTASKNRPYHFDENRRTATITSYGNAPVIEIDGGTIGSVVERFIDFNDDDVDKDAHEVISQTFAYSHSLINRGTIFANGLNDGIGATALRIGKTGNVSTALPGGVLNTGTVRATAYNNNAVAIDIANNDADIAIDLGNGGRTTRKDVFLNEGSIFATIRTNTKTKSSVTKSTHSAIGVRLAGTVDLPASVGNNPPLFINRGRVNTTSTHFGQVNNKTTIKTGEKAIAFDFSAYNDALDFTQELRRNDTHLGDGKYRAGGDEDLDRVGTTDSNKKAIADGLVTTQDVTAPSVVGNILFGAGDNNVVMTAGTMTGSIDFAGGTNTMVVSNGQADPVSGSTYKKPDTVFRGAVKNSGALSITIGENTEFHFQGQEIEQEGVVLDSLTVSGDGVLGFKVDTKEVARTTSAVVKATNLDLNGSRYTINPDVSRIDARGILLRLIQTESDLSGLSSTINSRLTGNHPFIYKVSLQIERDVDGGTDDAMTATLALKSAADLGLNKTEAVSYPAVIDYFSSNKVLETAFISLTTKQSLQAAYDQILPQYGDGTARRLATLVGSATGAISQHMQLVRAGGRRGADGWLHQFGDFQKQDASQQSKTLSGTSYSVGFGYDAPLAGLDALGVFTQMNWSAVNEKSSTINEVTSEGAGLGVYMSEDVGLAIIELTAQSGSVNMDSVRWVNFNNLVSVLRGTWDATYRGVSAKFIVPIFDASHLLQGEFGGDYFSFKQDGYTETEVSEKGLAMQLGGTQSDITSTYVGLRGGRIYGNDAGSAAIFWKPGYFVGYKTINDYKPYHARANFAGQSKDFILKTHEEIADRALINLNLVVQNEFFAFELNYRGEFGDGVETHGGGLGIRLHF